MLWLRRAPRLSRARSAASLTSGAGLGIMAGDTSITESRAGPPDMPLLRIDAVLKRFGEFVAVDRLSLDIASGEFFALLGPSGCGKTTLLRMIAGFEAPDAGRILLGGQDIAAVLPHQRP